MDKETNLTPLKVLKAVTKLKVELTRQLDLKHTLHNSDLFINSASHIFKIKQLHADVQQVLTQKPKRIASEKRLQWQEVEKCVLEIDLMKVLVQMDEVENEIRISSESLEEPIDHYLSFLDLMYQLRNSTYNNVKVLDDMQCVNSIILNVNFHMAFVICKLKKIFFENVTVRNNHMTTCLTLNRNNPTVTESTWSVVVMSLEKIGQLDLIIGDFFNDFMTYYINPIMNLDQKYHYSVKEESLTLKLDMTLSVVNNVKKRCMDIANIFYFLFTNMPTSSLNAGFSLVEKIGGAGKGVMFLRRLIGWVMSNEKEDGLECLDMLDVFVKKAHKAVFIDGVERMKLLELSNHFRLKYSELLKQADDLIKTNLHNTVTIKSASKHTLNGFNRPNPIETILFKDCSISQSVFQLVELFYERVEVRKEKKKQQKKSAVDSNITKDMTQSDFTLCDTHINDNTTINTTVNNNTINDTTTNNNKTNDTTINNNTTIDTTINNNTTYINTTYNNTTYNNTINNNTINNTLFNNTINNNNNTLFNNEDKSQTTFISLLVSQSLITKRRFTMKKFSMEEVSETYLDLYNTSQLFLDVRLEIHRHEIENSAFLTALHHNDCKWIAHHLFLIQHIMNPFKKESKRKRKPSKNTKSNKKKENKENIDNNNHLDVYEALEAVFLPLGYSFLVPCDALHKMARDCLDEFVNKEKMKIHCLIKNAFEKNKRCNKKRKLFESGVKVASEVVKSLKKAWMDVMGEEQLAVLMEQLAPEKLVTEFVETEGNNVGLVVDGENVEGVDVVGRRQGVE